MTPGRGGRSGLRNHSLNAACLKRGEQARDGIAGIQRGDPDRLAGGGHDGVDLALNHGALVGCARCHHHIQHNAPGLVDSGVLFVGRLRWQVAAHFAQRSVRVGRAHPTWLTPGWWRFGSRYGVRQDGMGRRDGIGVRIRDRVPRHVSPDQRGVDVHDLALGNAGRHTGLHRAGQDRLEALRTPTLADAGQRGMIGQRLVQAVADEPADGEIDLRLTHETSVVHEAEQEP